MSDVTRLRHYSQDLITNLSDNTDKNKNVLQIFMITCHLAEKLLGAINLLNPELNPICYLLALLGAHHFLHVSRIRV